jgi:hypothetical protein
MVICNQLNNHDSSEMDCAGICLMFSVLFTGWLPMSVIPPSCSARMLPTMQEGFVLSYQAILIFR